MNRSNGIEPAQELMTSRPVIGLDGEWGFSYDPASVGEKDGWFATNKTYPEIITVPGCDQAAWHPSAGISEKEFREKSHPQLKYPCDAPAWHQKRFIIPAEWRGREVWLHLGGVKPAAAIWFNGVKLGDSLSSRCPIRCNLTRLVRFGVDNAIVVRTYWPKGARLDGLFDGSFVFSGLYRGVRVESVPLTSIWGLHIIGRIHPPSVNVHIEIAGPTNGRTPLLAVCDISDLSGKILFSGSAQIEPSRQFVNHCSLTIDMPAALLWSIQTPHFYQAVVTLVAGNHRIDSAGVRFGLREIRCDGLKILLNGKPVFLRGACDNQFYPTTISPPVSKKFYAERLAKARKYGFNYLRRCIEIFTEESLDAADEMGMLVCQEMPFGLSPEFRKNIFQKMPAENKDLYRRELQNIIRSNRNHPSVIMYSMESEFYTRELSDDTFNLFCRELPALAKTLNPTALVIDITHTGGNWTGIEKQGSRCTDLIEECIGLTVPDQERQEPLSHPIPGRYDELTRPYIIHEYNWWSSLPEPALKPRYEKLPLKQTGVPELEAAAVRIGVMDQLPVWVDRSRKLKYLLQKSGLEVARRNSKISGYHFWLVSGLSFCQEGVFNEFHDEPPDMSAEEFRTFNDDTVLLLDDGNRRVFECGRTVSLGIEVSHFGPERIRRPQLQWRLLNQDSLIEEGQAKLGAIECGTVTTSHKFTLKMPACPMPATLKLRTRLTVGNRELCYNAWTLWSVPPPTGGEWVAGVATDLPFLAKAYPEIKKLDESALAGQPVVITAHLSEALIAYLDGGGRLVLLSERVLNDYGPGVEWCPGGKSSRGETVQNNDLFRSVPYCRDNHGNMGTVVVNHPALGGMPHKGWCDLNFLPLISGVYPILLEYYHPKKIHPIIRSIGHQNTGVNKAYLFEVRVGKGALLATSFKLRETYATYPESRYLMDCLLAYAAGSAFSPSEFITRDVFVASLRKKGSDQERN